MFFSPFSHLSTQIEISHMNPRQNLSWLTSQPSQLGSCEEALSHLLNPIQSLIL